MDSSCQAESIPARADLNNSQTFSRDCIAMKARFIKNGNIVKSDPVVPQPSTGLYSVMFPRLGAPKRQYQSPLHRFMPKASVRIVPWSHRLSGACSPLPL